MTKNEDLTLIFKLTGDFKKNLSKRSSLFLSYYALPKILEWHYKVWQKEMPILGKGQETLNEWSSYYQLSSQLDQIFIEIEDRALTDNTMDIFTFFDHFQKHVEKHKDDKIKVKEGDERYYIEDIFQNFYRNFFDKADTSPNRYHIWDHYFPESWKVKADTLKDNVFQRIALVYFLQWAADRISKAKEKDFDRALNEASEELFPEVYPLWWTAILTTVLSPYDPAARIKYLIEMPWTFGGFGRIRSLEGSWEDTPESQTKQMKQMRQMDQEEKDKTVHLVKSLMKFEPHFYRTFESGNLKKLLEQAKTLKGKYDHDTNLEHKRDRLEEIFEAMLKAE